MSTPVIESQDITPMATSSALTLAQRRAPAEPARGRTPVASLDVARAAAGRSEGEHQIEEKPYSRPGTAGRTMSPQQAPAEQNLPYRNAGDGGETGVTVSASFAYAPDATAPIPSMPATITSMSPGGDGLAATRPTLPDAGELPNSMFKEYDLLSVAAHKLSEHQARRATTRDGSMSPVRELRPSDVDWTYTPCPSPRDTTSVRRSRAGSRRTSGRSTPVTTGARTYRSVASRTAAGAPVLAGPFGGGSLRSVPDAEDARLHVTLQRPASHASSVASNVCQCNPGYTGENGIFTICPAGKYKAGGVWKCKLRRLPR